MDRLEPCADFDAGSLAAFLNVSFQAWQVEATAEVSRQTDWSVLVRAADGRELRVSRVEAGGYEGLPAWRFGPLDMPTDVAQPAASLVALIAGLRMELDDDFTPHRLLMGSHATA